MNNHMTQKIPNPVAVINSELAMKQVDSIVAELADVLQGLLCIIPSIQVPAIIESHQSE